ncbi:hypothetical protein Pelo_11414 [Pelomyxa schiedti]|nr:hypothetical protein Pelo_11414 [Pelomyxa schiedti]
MFEVLTESYPWGNLSKEEWHAKVLKGNPLEIPARIRCPHCMGAPFEAVPDRVRNDVKLCSAQLPAERRTMSAMIRGLWNIVSKLSE